MRLPPSLLPVITMTMLGLPLLGTEVKFPSPLCVHMNEATLIIEIHMLFIFRDRKVSSLITRPPLFSCKFAPISGQN